MHRLTRTILVALVLAVPVLNTLLHEQSSTTSLRGTVSDPQGAILPDAC
jgi:hypothetical protein